MAWSLGLMLYGRSAGRLCGAPKGVVFNEVRFGAAVSKVQTLPAENLPFADWGRGGVEDKARPFINVHPGLWVDGQGKLQR